jgi:hypothetical protein
MAHNLFCNGNHAQTFIDFCIIFIAVYIVLDWRAQRFHFVLCFKYQVLDVYQLSSGY